MLVLKYNAPFILLFLTFTCPTAVLSGFRILVLFSKFQFYNKRLLELLISNQGIAIPVPYSNKTQNLKIQNLKFQDKICLKNFLFLSKSLNNLSQSIFNTWFSFSSDQQNY